jgi:hypothetical protein
MKIANLLFLIVISFVASKSLSKKFQQAYTHSDGVDVSA